MNNVNWKIYHNVLIPDVPPHYEINISQNEIKELMKKFKLYFIRFCNERDRNSGDFWYVIKDEFTGVIINLYKK